MKVFDSFGFYFELLGISKSGGKTFPFAIPQPNRQNSCVDGLLIIDKPAGLSSHDVINRARRILCTKRIGHTGTLDPFATGVLVLLIGQATRLAQFVNTDEKEYLAVARCGFATDTGDLTGSRLLPQPGNLPVPRYGYAIVELEKAIAPFRGEIQQIPPMYSAKKVGGRKLYELARRGEEIERESVTVEIKQLEVVTPFVPGDAEPPQGTWDLGFRVVCSSGTYIRTLAEEIGAGLRTGAHLIALQRTRAGKFCLNQALTLEQLADAADTGSVAANLLPPSAALPDMTALHLDAEGVRRAKHGMPVSVDGTFEPGARLALYEGTTDLLGVGEYDADSGAVKPRVMFSTADQHTTDG